MKIKCSNCGKVVTRPKKAILEGSQRLGVDFEDYKSIYLCIKCRMEKMDCRDIEWWSICCVDNLPLWFLEKYKDKMDWFCTLSGRQLPEPFIEKMSDVIDWSGVSAFQKLSPEFVIKHIDKITEDILCNPVFKSYPESLQLLLETKV